MQERVAKIAGINVSTEKNIMKQHIANGETSSHTQHSKY